MTTGSNPVSAVFSALNTLRSELEGLLLPILNQVSTSSGSISENAVQRVLDSLSANHDKVVSAVTKATGEKPSS